MKRQVKDIISVVLVFLAIIAAVGLIGSLVSRNNGDEEGTENEEVVKCDHEPTTVKVVGKESTFHYIACGKCSVQLSSVTEVPNTVSFYADLTKIAPQTDTSNVSVKFENGMAYASAEWLSDTGNVIMNEDGEHGKYLAVKYRVNSPVKEGESVSLRLQPYLNDQANKYGTSTDEAVGEWVIAVVNISGLDGYDVSQKNYFCFSHKSTLDIAFIAMADELSDICTLLDENETLYFRDAFNHVSGQVEIDKDGNCVGEHTVSVSSEAVDSGTAYRYSCAACEYEKVKLLPESVTYFSDFSTYRYWDGVMENYVTTQYEDEVFFTRSSYNEGNTLQTTVTKPPSTDVIEAKYMVIKYRVGDEANKYLVLDFKFNDDTTARRQTISADDAQRGEWTVAVVDISSYLTPGLPEHVHYFWSRFQHIDTLDVAYVALATDLEGVQALLDEGETYFDRGSSFANVATQVEYNKDGTVVEMLPEETPSETVTVEETSSEIETNAE